MSKLVVMKEAMNTMYCIDSLAGRFQGILDECAKNHDIVDLAGCRIMTTCASIMSMDEYYKNITFINSEDPELNEILEHNRKVVTEPIEEYEDYDVSRFKSLRDIIIEIQNLSKETGRKLKPIVHSETRSEVAAICFIIAACPNVEFDIGHIFNSIYDFIKDYHTYDKDQKFYYVQNRQRVGIVERDVNGLYNGLTEAMFINNSISIPGDFGTEYIFKCTEDGSEIKDSWYQFIEACCNILNSDTKENAVKSYNSIFDFIEMRG